MVLVAMCSTLLLVIPQLPSDELQRQFFLLIYLQFPFFMTLHGPVHSLFRAMTTRTQLT